MKNTRAIILLVSVFILTACNENPGNEKKSQATSDSYFADNENGVKTGGVKIIQVETPKGKYNIWTKRFGNNPSIKLLLLNGGPGATHEYFECVESFLPAEGIEFIYYDQLGCGNSDNPNDTSLWDLERFVEEVEQVRVALNLTKENFYLLGHSWGGILAFEYSMKYQDNLKGLIISNMMCSAPQYDKYANDVLAKQMDPAILDSIRMMEEKGDFANPRYMELLMPNFYAKHICRIPMEEWPEPMVRSFNKLNQSLYVTMQGPSEFGISGKLENWDRSKDLSKLSVPVLTIGATHDTMDPEYMKWMSTQVQNGSFLLCPNGSHMCFFDDQDVYMKGLIKWLKETNDGKMKVEV